ncbi:MAG: DUF4249 family protein [Candidatus Marinimicrobia bacterium]|nr:DUF4249 family protein [Candidatus Neomarinimicrobiota bacterium]
MKNILLFLIFVIGLFTGCEHVVDIDLNVASPALVVEGRVIKDSLAFVKIHETSSYFQPDTQRCICNAQVLIREGDNTTDTLEQIAPGRYRSNSIRGTEGMTYYLTIVYEDESFEAQSYLPSKPLIYSLSQRSFASFGEFGDSADFDFGGGTSLDSLPWFLFTNIHDDPETEDYYMFEYYVNGEQKTGRYNVSNDENAQNDTLRYSPGPTALFYTGDTVTVRTYAIDEGLYTYFDMLSDALSSNSFFSSTPYNPVLKYQQRCARIFCRHELRL